MTRKDCEAIARAFKVTYPKDTDLSGWDVWYSLRGHIADIMEGENHRFDRERFYRATEGGDK